MQESWRLHGASKKVDLMGLLDDLAMGFGLKERTEDYDARTARTIAANEAAAKRGRAGDVMALAQARNPSHFSYIGDDATSSEGARTFLNRIGGESYRPQPVQDDRTMFQRLLFSPESDPSPTRYAIGPLKMDQPLPSFGLLGMLSGFGGMLGRDVPTVSADTSPMRVRPVSGYNLGGSGQAGTRFDMTTEAEPIDYSDAIPVQDPATIAATEALDALPDMVAPSYVPEMQSAPAGREFDINFLENTRVPRAIDLERPLPLLPEDPTYYSGIDVDVPTIPTPDVIQLPNGLYVNRRTGKVFR